MTRIAESFNSFRKWLAEKDDVPRTMPFFCKTIILIIIVGVVVRLLLGPVVTYVFDIYHWGAVIQNINSGNGLYEITGYFYTPLWGYILGLESMFQSLIGVTNVGERLTDTFLLEDIGGYYTSTIVTPLFSASLKLIFLIADLVVGYLIFWIIRDITKDRRKAVIGFGLWFLCPFVVVIGAISGMFDTISVLMVLLSVILLRKGRYMESGVMLCLATLTKFFPGFFVLFFVAYIIAKNKEDGTSLKKTALFLIGIIVTALIIFMPQILDGTLADCFLFITSRVSEGMNAGIIGDIAGYIALIVYAATFIVSGACARCILKNKDGSKLDSLLFDSLLITTAVMFLYPPLPQYILLLLPFILFAFTSNRRYRLPLILLMIGTTTAVLAGGPMNLVSFAAFTDMLDLGTVMSAVEFSTAHFMGAEWITLVGYAGYLVQYAGILLVLWIRFGDEIRSKIKNGRNRSEDTSE